MNNPQRMQAYRQRLQELLTLKEIAQVIVQYLPGDFSLTKEEALSESIGILEETPIFDDLSRERPQAAPKDVSTSN